MKFRNLHLVWIIMGTAILTACHPDHRVVLAEKLMAEKETDSAIVVMNGIEKPLSLPKRDYALYALLMSEAMHRKGRLDAATDTLLVSAIDYFSTSGDSLYAERALYCKGHLERRIYRYDEAMKCFLKALLFLQGSNNDEQLYRVNTWLGVVCMNQGEYLGKMRYSKEALKAAVRMGNNFYKNMALCDIATGYFFMSELDSALSYAKQAHAAALTDSVPQQLTQVYTELGYIYTKKKEYKKALEYINESLALRPEKDSLAIFDLYATKIELFGYLGQYDSACHYFAKASTSSSPGTQGDAHFHMAKASYEMGHALDAYPLLSRYVELADTIQKQRHTEEAIALQEFYRHEELSMENLYWRSRAAERLSNVYLMTTIALLMLWTASALYLIYRRNRRRLIVQQQQLANQQQELHVQREVSSESLRRMEEMKQKEARLKEAFFRRLNNHVVHEIEQGKNIILSDEDWDDIVLNANLIFDGFTNRLQEKYPALNKDDLRYCCMVKMQLSQLEMSQIMHLEKDSVKKRLKRIRMEKMGADSGIMLEELLRCF